MIVSDDSISIFPARLRTRPCEPKWLRIHMGLYPTLVFLLIVDDDGEGADSG